MTVSSAAYADEQVTRNYQFSISAATELVIENSVGEIEFIRGQGNEISIELTVKSDDDGWFASGGDIHAVEMVDSRSGDELTLALEPDEDINAHWRITMPKVAHVDVDMGVGEVHGEVFTTDSRFDLGVGEIDLVLLGDDIRSIEANVGIGDTGIDGFRGGSMTNERAVVSSESQAKGQGNYRVTADIGVGDAHFEVRGLR